MEVSRKSDEHGKFPLIIDNEYSNGCTAILQNLRNVEENRMQAETPMRLTQWNSELVPLAT